MSDSVTSLGWARVAVHSVRTAITVAALTLLVAFGAISPSASPRPTGPARHLDMSSGPLDAMMQANRCSVTGFDRSVIPSKAIVRTPDGTTELVSFDRGWAVFSGEVAGELVAVCLGPNAAG
ncbi:hypothetical protein KVF89_19170 [Nocardioides carbamazepini]|uniref:hypothetical protein n=1 Tax=Nocardioides carbamazepini TaxID=2854259 RepID=UPI002149C6DC|nr:hypothetical protein [Nocardioides carbamazepini]MCR1784672.1 hypothetical protein [Nocardioides carbamazepini]